MAYMTDEQKDQQPNAAATPAVPGAGGTGAQAPMTSAGPGAGPTGAKGAPTGAATNTAAAQPFTNLNAYLTANAPQVQNQANTIAGNLTSQYGQTQNDINAGTSAFNQQVAGGYAAPNAQVVQQAAADPTNFAQTPGNVAAFQGQLNDQYTGPANFEGTTGYADLNNEVTTNAANAAQVNTLPGLQTYLQGTEKNPTQGENTLDSVLLNQSPNAIKTVQSAAAPFSQLPDYLAGNVTTSDQSVSNAQSQAAQAAQAANSAFLGPNGIAPAFQNTLNTQLTNAGTSRDAYNAALNANQTKAQAAQIALNNELPAATQQYTGNVANIGNSTSAAALDARIAALIDPSSSLASLQSYLNPNPITQPPTLADTANSGQYAEDAALQQLLGQLYNPSLDQANVGQAGSFNVPASAGTVPDTSGQLQYMGDIANLYGTPNANFKGAPNAETASPQSLAQYLLNENAVHGNGVNAPANDVASLQRIIANQYAGRG